MDSQRYLLVQEGVVAVLTASTTDVLSHLAIRARSQRTLLASCFNATELDELKSREGEETALVVNAAGSVTAAGPSQVFYIHHIFLSFCLWAVLCM